MNKHRIVPKSSCSTASVANNANILCARGVVSMAVFLSSFAKAKRGHGFSVFLCGF